jgi:hypothetical protein
MTYIDIMTDTELTAEIYSRLHHRMSVRNNGNPNNTTNLVRVYQPTPEELIVAYPMLTEEEAERIISKKVAWKCDIEGSCLIRSYTKGFFNSCFAWNRIEKDGAEEGVNNLLRALVDHYHSNTFDYDHLDFFTESVNDTYESAGRRYLARRLSYTKRMKAVMVEIQDLGGVEDIPQAVSDAMYARATHLARRAWNFTSHYRSSIEDVQEKYSLGRRSNRWLHRFILDDMANAYAPFARYIIGKASNEPTNNAPAVYGSLAHTYPRYECEGRPI